MAILRMIKCDVAGCSATAIEAEANAGWVGWGCLHGIALNGTENPSLCPEHLHAAAEFVDKLGAANGVD